jgi:hypothetical protein
MSIPSYRFDPRDIDRVLTRALHDKHLDRRTTIAKTKEAIVSALAHDWKGRLNAMPADARLLIDRLAILGVRLMFHEHAVLAGEADLETDRSLIAMNAAFRKSLELLAAEHAARARAVPSIAEFCEGWMRVVRNWIHNGHRGGLAPQGGGSGAR